MAASGISTNSHHASVAALRAPEPQEQVEPTMPEEPLETRLRREHAELGLLYAVEQQIAAARALPALVPEILVRVRHWLGFELAAAVIQHDTGGQLFAVHFDGSPIVQTLDSKHVQRLLGHARLPLRFETGTAGNLADLLLELPGLQALEGFSVPVSDGRAQIGILQVVNRTGAVAPEDEVLQGLGRSAVQLGRAVLLMRERAAAERADRLRLLGDAVNSVLEDIRSPLSTVGHCVDSLATDDAAGQRGEYAARADRALEHVDRMTREVLAFVRGQREVSVRPVQLSRFVQDVRELLAPELQRASCTLQIDAEYAGTARFDEGKLMRVLWSLARNACQAGADKFVWRSSRAGEQLLFECADNGRGIPVAAQAQLFESFVTHEHATGSGLGLAMAKKIVDAHCGRMYVSSDRGHGSVFRIELPL